jgi:hypothetical protein
MSTKREFDGPCIQEGCTGSYVQERPEDCSCHINPPCNACVEAPLVCDVCGDSE